MVAKGFIIRKPHPLPWVCALGFGVVFDDKSLQPRYNHYVPNHKLSSIISCIPYGIVPNHKLSSIIYFDCTWIKGQFKCHQWNYFNFEGPCINNHVEGWHSRLKKVVGKPHQLTSMKSLMSPRGKKTKMKIQMLEAGAQQAPRQKWVRQKERRNQNLFQFWSNLPE